MIDLTTNIVSVSTLALYLEVTERTIQNWGTVNGAPKYLPLHLQLWSCKLPPSKLDIGGFTAPLMRLFCFIEKTTAQDSVIREDNGRCLCSVDKSWAILFYQKNIGVVMPIAKNELSNVRLVETNPIDELTDKVAIMQLAVQGMFFIMSEHEGPKGLFCAGLMAAYNDLEIALEIYMKAKGDKLWNQ